MSNSNIEPYYLLRAALALFEKTPQELTPEERVRVNAQARNELELEYRVLNAPEAAGVIVTEQELSNAVKAISDRFETQESYLDELSRNDLDPQALQSALLRQCKVESVLERVAAQAASISDVEVGVFYHMHPEKFRSPELRAVRHILITVNDDYPENTRENAWQRIHAIASKLKRKPYKFADLAMQHSECPSALKGGELGMFPRGKLYPEIDQALFQLKVGQISEVVETEAGLHIVLCEKIHYGESISLKKATPKILDLMQERARRICQRAWLASLPSVAMAHTETES